MSFRKNELTFKRKTVLMSEFQRRLTTYVQVSGILMTTGQIALVCFIVFGYCVFICCIVRDVDEGESPNTTLVSNFQGNQINPYDIELGHIQPIIPINNRNLLKQYLYIIFYV
ncbi:MAG: hypothetical protein JKX76_01215 [Colwellia sp.]|nr:hypothetical protein [Colwellia sp.]